MTEVLCREAARNQAFSTHIAGLRPASLKELAATHLYFARN
jgi:hypothetical protein